MTLIIIGINCAKMIKGMSLKKEAKARESLRKKVLPKNWDIKDGRIEEEFFRAFEREEKHGVEVFKDNIRKDVEHRVNRAAPLYETLYTKIVSDYGVAVDF